eukprot:CAMPEP_0177701884 /NCGR_PEP_ID=MMETSP0484_2-20121128/6845_1 /TAXON_ID=354590 /ORGANISM="Rhodomonas lens, Strain RHODO" /LENGTH=123 /DNA_ID=CAMNT_0019213139 /DNA_START=364 /DNA_END=733 /DNA_ORIENTATION=+
MSRVMSRRGSSRSDPNQYEATNIDIEQLAHAFIALILVRAAPTSSQHVQNANMSEACPASSWPTRVPHMTLQVRRELWLGADDTGLTVTLDERLLNTDQAFVHPASLSLGAGVGRHPLPWASA